MAAPARSAPARFTEDFAGPRPSRWTVGDHPLGRSTLAPANVVFGGGRLALTLPAGTTDGAEVRTRAAFRRGAFAARLSAARSPSSITGFFLYAPPDYASEIDIEIFNDPTGTLLLTTYADGRETHHERCALGFDPTAAPHDYGIAWQPGVAAFSVDGRQVRRWTTGIPTAPMRLYLNAWFPRWLDGLAPVAPAATLVERVRARPA